MSNQRTFPSVHLNGTGKTTLTKEYDAAADALETFREKFGQITCHGRDYYVQGPDAYSKARDERNEIWAHISAVEAYLNDIRINLHDA
jgi:hypothetical protein